jgi:UDP-N-acetylmuramoyl-tripeptide--D-alanyl-D-alanine ligase
MARTSLAEASRATGGEITAGEGGTIFDRYAIDSRAVAGGELFFALKGPRHDAHDFLAEVFARGAAGVVVSRTVAAPAGVAVLRVADTTEALQQLAAFVRRRDPLHVAGITGSGGKTTTKEMTAAALATAWPTHRSSGNLNNTIGLPLSLLATPEGSRAAVLEMGMSTPGEMTRLAEIADPDVGVILNVSEAHRANFSSVREIARAKGELFRRLRSDATAVFNAADPLVRALGEAFAGPRLSFAVDGPADVTVDRITDDMVDGLTFMVRVRGYDPRPVRLAFYGRHNAANAAAALAVALAFEVNIPGAIRGIEALRAVVGRGVVERLGSGVVLVDETYNSNPAALASVLDSLAATAWPRMPSGDGRRVLVCGDMLELGDAAELRHREAGALAARRGVALLVAVGPLAGETASGAAAAGLTDIVVVADAEAAAKSVDRLRAGDLVVVKGSRGMAMERFAAAVRGAF